MKSAIRDFNWKMMNANKKGGVHSQEQENQISDEVGGIIN
jgi:hypothetical protein